MKKWFILFVLLVLVVPQIPAAVGVSGQVDLMSRYIWRGFDLAPQNNPALQPSVNFTFGESGFSANVWGNFALSNRDNINPAEEIDLTLTYTAKTAENISLSAGVVTYFFCFAKNFTFGDHVSPELFVSLGLPQVPLTPTVSVYYDLNLGQGLYTNLKLSQGVPLDKDLELTLSTTLGFNSKLYIEKSGFSDLTFSAALPLKLGGLTLTGQANYTLVLLDEVNADNEFWVGLSLGFGGGD